MSPEGFFFFFKKKGEPRSIQNERFSIMESCLVRTQECFSNGCFVN